MSSPTKKKTLKKRQSAFQLNDEKFKREEEEEIIRLKKEIELEKQAQNDANFDNNALERSVRMLERSVMELEAGNLSADDSEIKVKYDNQRQLNVQLQEQKRWLEHELEQVRRKMKRKGLPRDSYFSFRLSTRSKTSA